MIMEKEVRQLAYSLFEELIEKVNNGLDITDLSVEKGHLGTGMDKAYSVWFKHERHYLNICLYYDERVESNPDRVEKWRKAVEEIEKRNTRSVKGFIKFLKDQEVFDKFEQNLKEQVIDPTPSPVLKSLKITDTESYLEWIVSTNGNLDKVFARIFDLKESEQGEAFWRKIEKEWNK